MKKEIIIAATAIVTMPVVNAALVISEIDVTNDRVELVNTGAGTENISTYWLCNRVNGSPFYSQVSSATINVGLSTATSLSIEAGEILVLDLGSGILSAANGELGIYNTNSFGSASAIEDYVLWGANGIRDLVAQNAGIWTDNDSIDVSGLGAGDTIQLSLSQDGNSAGDYSVAAQTLGVAQSVPEPSSLALASLAGIGLLRRKRK